MHVVRCFEDENIIHVESSIDPERDMAVISLELALADIDQVITAQPWRLGAGAGSSARVVMIDVMMVSDLYRAHAALDLTPLVG